jgi:hypothetical protein
MGEGTTNPLRRCLVERGEHVVHVPDVKPRILPHDVVCASPPGFVRLDPSAFVLVQIGAKHPIESSMQPVDRGPAARCSLYSHAVAPELVIDHERLERELRLGAKVRVGKSP